MNIIPKKILSICIPTYNRASYLRKCLDGLYTQIDNKLEDAVEIIVSDNASTDDTSEVVKNYLHRKNFTYRKNDSNLGMDGNFYACYRYATGKFAWIFSDDDFLLQGALSLICNLLSQNQDIGVCYLNSEWVDDVGPASSKHVTILKERFYTSSKDFMHEVNYWITFLTGNIFNKDLVFGKIYPEENMGTLFVQLSWVIPAIYFSQRNVIIETKTIICKANNTGGYKLFEVFGINLNLILDRMIGHGIIKKYAKNVINQNLINNFFPIFISSKGSSFKSETIFFTLVKVFWPYKDFWTRLVPIIFKNKFKSLF